MTMKSVLHSWLMVLLCIGWAACSQSDEALVQENVPVQVGLTLTTGAGYGSRALPGESGETKGTGYENFIDIANRDFRFYVFDGENKFVTEVKVLMVIPVDNSEYPSVYHLTAELDEMPPETFKMVAIANWPAYPASNALVKGTTTIEDICKASEYTYVRPFVPSASRKIPMYGVRTYTGKTFRPNLSTELEEICMLRAMAKVEVRLADDLTGYTLSDAKITHFSGEGMAAPIGVYDDSNQDWEDMHIDPKDLINTGSIVFPVKEDDKSCIIYLPEYKNVGAEYPSYMTVTLNEKEYPIYFRHYVDGKPTDERINIVRNHHYVFTVTKVGAAIEVTYTVADWIHEEENHHWVQDFAYPTYENVIPWSFIEQAIDYTAEIEVNPTMYYWPGNWTGDVLENEVKGAFEVAFKMTGPENQKWIPFIRNAQTDDYEVRVYRKDEEALELLKKSDYWIASENWYKIQIIPKVQQVTYGNKNRIWEFGITTSLHWTVDGETVYLLINGEDAQTIRWPNSGQDARIIEITQVEPPTTDGNGTESNT